MKRKNQIFKQNRINYTVTKGQDRFVDYFIKPVFMGGIMFLSNFLGRRMTKRPVTVRTQLICEASNEVADDHNDGILTRWAMTTYFWVTARILEFDNAYYIRYHKTLVRYVEKLEQNNLIQRVEKNAKARNTARRK